MIKIFALGIRLFLEVTMLISLGVSGYKLGFSPFSKWTLALLLPILLGVFWALFVSPGAPYTPSESLKLVYEFIVLITLFLLFYSTLGSIYTIALFFLIVANKIILLVFNW